MTGPSRRLIVMRHAHAEPPSFRHDDIGRSLTDRGHSDARRRGPEVRELNPELVLCSSAHRATQTMAALALGDIPTLVEPAIYQASPDDLCRRLMQIDPDVETAMLIGHLPTVRDLVEFLAVDVERVSGFSPAAMAVLAMPGTWQDVVPHRATVVSFYA